LIVILDYGMGNLRSVQKAVEFLGYECRVQAGLSGASKVVLPGVGAFGAAMEKLSPYSEDIRRFVSDGGSLLGICLGQQLLFESSEEHGGAEGLGILQGHVRYLQPHPGNKVPNVGWSKIAPKSDSRLLAGTSCDDQVYFVHSLFSDCRDSSDVAATSEHSITFPAAIERANVWATQFHPEKSGKVGLRILRNFLEC